jgi:hypothetical protein
VEKQDPDPREGRTNLWVKPKSLFVALALALAYFVSFYVWFAAFEGGRGHSSDVFLTLAFLVGAPAAAASLAVCICDPKGHAGGRDHIALGLLVTLLILAGGVLFFREGGLCTVMAAPLFVPAGVLAALLTGRACRRRGGRVHAMAFPLVPLLLLQVEQTLTPPTALETVVDTVIVNAAPREVWRHLVEVRDIRREELGWTFTQDLAGVPKPIDARLDRPGVGGMRHVQWGGGIRFGEEIVRWEEERHLAWRFRFTADSVPAAIEQHVRVDAGYLSIDEGNYRLEPLPGGRTRLTLTTHYRVSTNLNGYAAWWGRILIGDFHRNVLKVITGRAEPAE